ncbi:glycosyltransferase family 4 protein [Marinobacter nitratireducens]|uniref:glycosyltransferase family 4 protein n=1 Tax=Marinobacter nitratireducens TaxID=1137280 RepID=UPI0019173068|nr:glycosyltransferase family 4 protein [Marinobacter nitratireducens]
MVHKFHRLTGGAEVFYFEVARVLKKNGHKVAFFSTENEENIDTGDTAFSVKAPGYSNGNIFSKVWNSRDIFYSSLKKKRMKEAIEEFKPDIVHAFAIHVHLTPSVLEAAKEAGVPVVMSCNDYKHICPNYKLYDGWSICEDCKGGHFYNAILKRCSKNSLIFSTASAVEAYIHESKNVYDDLVDKYLFASEFMLEKTKEFWASKSVNYGILRNPFDCSKQEPVYGGGFALYFGRIVDEKGVDRIVQSAKNIDFPIKIVGDGPELAQLKSVVETESITNVEFLGALWGDDLDKILSCAAFVIVPSLWHENFPYVIFQSFAAGKPVIGSRRGGIPELIGADRGLIFDPDSVSELSNAIRWMSENPDQAIEMGRKGRHFVENEFNDDNFYREIMSNYRSVLG